MLDNNSVDALIIKGTESIHPEKMDFQSTSAF